MKREHNREQIHDEEPFFYGLLYKIIWSNIQRINVIVLMISAFFTSVTFVGCGDNKEQTIKRPLVSGIETQEIKPAQVDTFYETSGTVRAKTVSVIASRVMGTIVSIKAQEGDYVKAGDILASIDSRDAAQRMAAAEAAVNEAQHNREVASEQRSLADITYRRYKNLYDEKVISRQEFDQIEMQKKVADAEYARTSQMLERTGANLEEARVNYGFFQIKTPISGIVTQKKTEIGSMATPGMHLYTVEDVSQFKIETTIDEGLSGKITRGMTVHVVFDRTGEQVDGRVTKVVPFVDPGSRTFPVEIVFHNTRSLKSGSYVKILIPFGKKETLLVPDKSLVERGQLTGVFVVDSQGVITYRLIKTGKTYSGQTEVLSGLTKGDKVIISGIEKAVDGGVVKDK